MNTVQDLPVNVYTASTIEQAWEVLMGKCVDIIFCDENLPDGAYPDFLCAVRSEHKLTRFVVLLSSEEWEEYLQAIRLGASDVLRGSCQPTDIELVLIRAGRDIGQQEEFRMAASA